MKRVRSSLTTEERVWVAITHARIKSAEKVRSECMKSHSVNFFPYVSRREIQLSSKIKSRSRLQIAINVEKNRLLIL